MTEKFKNLVHYICWKADDPAKLGATKLNKILWYVDTFAYRLYGESVTGEVYIKRQNGPVPKRILPAIDRLQADGRIVAREREYFGYKKREFIALLAPDAGAFAEREIKIIDDVIDAICNNHSASSISELSHDQIWEAATMGEELPIYATLAALPGELTDEVLAWADSVVQRVEEQRQQAA